MSRGVKRAGERGAESLEFVGLLPLLLIVLFLAWQGLILLRQTSEAQDDARTLARAAAICGTGAAAPLLSALDPNVPPGSSAQVTSGGGYVTAHVRLTPISVLKSLDLQAAGFPPPSGNVVMRHEPC